MSDRRERIRHKLAQLRAIYIGPFSLAGGTVVALITAAIWIWRQELFLLYQERTALIPATFVAIAIAMDRARCPAPILVDSGGSTGWSRRPGTTNQP
jgi:hypothetical protein